MKRPPHIRELIAALRSFVLAFGRAEDARAIAAARTTFCCPPSPAETTTNAATTTKTAGDA